MPAMLRLSVLDQSPIPEGGSGGQSLHNSLELAALADRLGFHRFWMAEHHATPALASASPEVMLAAIGLATERIRLGTGGIMLPHYSAFKIAESFSMLAGLLPGRIDLGLGRAPGSDQLTAYALQQDRRTRAPNSFPDQLVELMAHFDRSLPDDHPFRHLGNSLPGGQDQPEIWVLGSSPDSAQLAGALGLPYCIAEFIAGDVPWLADQYRAAFEPSVRAKQPKLMLACWAIAAETEARAHWLAAPSRMMFAHIRTGRSIAVPHPDAALAWLEANPQQQTGGGRVTINGTPDACRAAIESRVSRYGAEEVILVNILHDHADRLESYRLIAAEMLAPASRAPVAA